MNDMTNGDVADLVRRGEKAAFLLGQVAGKVHNLVQMTEWSPEKVREEALNLLHHINASAGEIYYSEEVYNIGITTGVKDENIED